MYQLTCSIVLYNNKPDAVCKVINSVLQSGLNLKLYLVDNSETDDFKNAIRNHSIDYIFNNKNIGYGAAHNVALRMALHESRYHLILNPDVDFDTNVLKDIYVFMEANKGVGQLMPKVFYRNGDLQKLCNPLPKPMDLIGRRFFADSNWTKKRNDEYELKGFNYDYCLNVPNLSGCFMFLRCSVLKQTGLFDERYFMYMEDIDLCRRIHAVSKTIFYPCTSIIHGFEKESYNNPILLRHHIISAIKYFNKWGWFFDKQRTKFNKNLLLQISQHNYLKQSIETPSSHIH